MLQRNHSQDRCILFPQSQGAVDCIESNELDKRYEIEVIDFSYSQMSKLELFGFFAFSDFRIKQNSFVKLSPDDIEKAIESALGSRKQTRDIEMLRLVDLFISKAKRSKRLNLPIWFST